MKFSRASKFNSFDIYMWLQYIACIVTITSLLLNYGAYAENILLAEEKANSNSTSSFSFAIFSSHNFLESALGRDVVQISKNLDKENKTLVVILEERNGSFLVQFTVMIMGMICVLLMVGCLLFLLWNLVTRNQNKDIEEV